VNSEQNPSSDKVLNKIIFL